MKEVFIIGGGDLAKKVIRLLQKIGSHKIIGYIDVEDKGEIFGISYLGTDDFIESVNAEYSDIEAILAISHEFLQERIMIINKLVKSNIGTPTICSKKTYIDKYAHIGDGCVIFDGAYIDFDAEVGDFSIININSVICHGVKLSGNNNISPGNILSGGVELGKNVFVGSNSTINPYVKIASNCIIGAGSVVVRDCNLKGTYVGNPSIIITN